MSDTTDLTEPKDPFAELGKSLRKYFDECEAKAREFAKMRSDLAELQKTIAGLTAERDGLKKRIRVAVRNLRHCDHEPRDEPGPLSGAIWAKVSYVFGLGCTSSHALCREYGIDPETGEEITNGT